MATQKTSTSKKNNATAQATQEKKGTKPMNIKELPVNTIIELKPNNNFILTPYKNKTFISATGNICIEYEKELINETLNIYKYSDTPAISDDYQTFWTDSDNNLYQINVTPAVIKDNKTYSTITYFIKDLLTQLNVHTDIQSYTSEQIMDLFKYIKSLNQEFQFIITENISKAGNTYRMLKPVKGQYIKDTADNFSL